MDIIIRQVIEKDTPSLLPLMEQLGYKISEADLLENIQLHLTAGYNLFVAESHGKLTGFISIHFYRYPHLKENLGRITALCTDAEHRSFGLGGRLLTYAEEYLKSKNCKVIELTSGSQREDAHRFYERQGYIEKRKRFVKEI